MVLHSACVSVVIGLVLVVSVPRWEAANAEIKVPSGENTELKRSPFKTWSRSIYKDIHATFTVPGISSLLISTLPIHSPAFYFQNLSRFSCVGCG